MRRLEAGGLLGQGGSARSMSLVTPAFPRCGRFLYHLRGGIYQNGRMRWPATPVRSSRLPIDPNAKSRPQDNPDFDDLVLDEALYRELGITEEELREQRERTAADVADPEGFDLGFDDISSLNENVPMDLRLRLLDKGVFGPEAVILAGFRLDEVAMTRAVLDSAGGHAIKVLPVTDEMLYASVDEAVQVEETDWSQPRPEMWNQPCAWGAKRAVLFSGLSIKAQATVLELMEGTGLKGVAACMAVKPEAQRRLGDVLAEAVKEHRKAVPEPTLSEKELLWRELGGRVMDGKGPGGFEDLSQLLGDKARRRLNDMPEPEEGEAGEAGASALDGLSLGDLAGLDDEDVLDLGGMFDDDMEMQLPVQGQPQEQIRKWQQQGSDAEPADGEAEEEASELERNVLRSAAASRAAAASKAVPLSETPDAALQSTVGSRGGQAGTSQAQSPPSQDQQPPAPAQVASEQDEDELFAMAEFRDILDSMLPDTEAAASGMQQGTAGLGSVLGATATVAAVAGAAAASGGSSTSQNTGHQAGATSSGSSSNMGGAGDAARGASAGGRKPGSVLSQIQSALQAGVPPDELKKLIDEAAAAMAAQEQQQEQAGTAGSTGGGVRPSTPRAAASPPPPRPLGPERPPQPRQDDPLLNLRPEARKALEGKNIKFVDLSKLPSKYRNQMADQMRAKRQQQMEAKMAQAAQMAQRDVRQQGLQQQQRVKQQEDVDFDPEEELERLAEEIAAEGLAGGLDRAAAGGEGLKVSEGEVMPPGWRPPGLPREEEEDNGMIDVDELERLAAQMDAQEPSTVTLDAEQVLLLKQAAESEGLDPDRALAEAVAMGVKLSPDAVQAVQSSGMQLPSGQMIADIRASYAEDAAREQEREEKARQAREQADARRRMAAAGRSSGGRRWGAGLARAAASRRPGGSAEPAHESSGGAVGGDGSSSGDASASEVAGRDRGGADDAGFRSARNPAQAGARTLTVSELRRIAERKGLDLQVLLDDARAKGVEIADE